MIGIVGQGFVGNAVYQKWKKYYTVQTYDIDENKSTSTLHNLVMMCDTIFVCLPTPMKDSGECDLNILYSSLFEINTLTEFEEKEVKLLLLNQLFHQVQQNNLINNINILIFYLILNFLQKEMQKKIIIIKVEL